MSGVYQIYNTVNGKRYIGSSIHIEQRFKEYTRNTQGYCGKLNCTFVQISKEEYEEATA